MDLIDFTEQVGERIIEWVDTKFTIENGLIETPSKEDFGYDDMSWRFTQKGQRLYESYLKKAQRLIERKFPNEGYEDLERYTGVIYP